MRFIGFAFVTVCLLGFPSLAAEYQGASIDGRKLAAKVYSYETGGVYDAEVQFDGDQAAIVFSGGGQLQLTLRQPVITDLKQIEGYGRLGQISIGKVFSIGLSTSSDDNLTLQRRNALGDLWRIRLESVE
jgi:hypothetical protein